VSSTAWQRLQARASAARADSLIRNSGFGMATTVVTSAFGFLYWLLAARFFDATDVGLAAALIAAMMLASTVSNPGLQSILVERLPRRQPGDEWSTTLNATLVVGGLTAVIAGLLCVAVLPAMSSEFDLLQRPTFAAVFAVGVVLTTAATLVDYAFIAEKAAGRTFVRHFVFAAVKLPIVVLPSVVALDALGILSSWVGSLAATVVATALFVPRLGRGYRLGAAGLRSEWQVVRARLAAHHATNLGNLLPPNILPILVAAVLAPATAAYFYATWRLAGILFMVSPSVATQLFVEGSHDPGQLNAHLRRSTRVTFALVLPGTVMLAALGYPVLLAFGPEYASEGFVLLLLLAVSAIPEAVGNLYSSVLRVQGRLRAAAVLSVVPSMAAVVVAWALMPSMGLEGVGLAWLGARVVVALIAIADLRRSRPVRLPALDDAETALAQLTDAARSAS
jgi:O-antigen/teichoic acid export membrane protein